MKRKCASLGALKSGLLLPVVCLLSASANGAPGSFLSYTGSLSGPQSSVEFTFTLTASDTITFQTWGFGGGTNAAGTSIPSGGFDSLITLFNSPAASIVTDGSGNPIADADNLLNAPWSYVGHCPPAGTVAIGIDQDCGDGKMQVALMAGTYTLVLTDANYIPNAIYDSGALSEGFTDLTAGVFQTCDPVSNACITPNTNYAVDISSPNADLLVDITLNTSPTGLQVSGDGGATYFTAPHVFQWVPNSQHTIVTTSPQSLVAGTRYVWLNWSDAGNISHLVNASGSITQYTANFQTQYLLTTQLSASSVVGSISPASEYVNPGTVVTVTATANPGFVFTGFSGGLSGTANPQNITVNAPVTVTANFNGRPTSLSGSVGSKSGPSNARVWQFTIVNNGPGGAVAAEIVSLGLRSALPLGCVSGPPVTSMLPAVAGDIAPRGTAKVSVTIDFSRCLNAVFTGNADLSANSGAASGVIFMANQAP